MVDEGVAELEAVFFVVLRVEDVLEKKSDVAEKWRANEWVRKLRVKPTWSISSSHIVHLALDLVDSGRRRYN